MLYFWNHNQRGVTFSLICTIFNINWTMCPKCNRQVFISHVKDLNVQFVSVRQDYVSLAIICPIIFSSNSYFVQPNVIFMIMAVPTFWTPGMRCPWALQAESRGLYYWRFSLALFLSPSPFSPQTRAPTNFRWCQWGSERRVKHGHTRREDPHRKRKL